MPVLSRLRPSPRQALRGCLLGLLALAGATCEKRAPDCNGAAQQLVDLCGYDEIQARNYYEGCSAFELAGDRDLYEESLAEADCILSATTCDDARACRGEEVEDTDQSGPPDGDGDGYAEDEDCDDADAGVHPDADEIPNDGIDQDCTGIDATACYEDSDGDNYGAGQAIVTETGCTEDQSSTDDDCDDSDASVHPDADEIRDDGIDQDCNGSDIRTCYYDLDGDGYGGSTIEDDDCCCNFIVAVGGDCNDSDETINPGADEVANNGTDDDCDGQVDE